MSLDDLVKSFNASLPAFRYLQNTSINTSLLETGKLFILEIVPWTLNWLSGATSDKKTRATGHKRQSNVL